jgi:hypothetical protein
MKPRWKLSAGRRRRAGRSWALLLPLGLSSPGGCGGPGVSRGIKAPARASKPGALLACAGRPVPRRPLRQAGKPARQPSGWAATLARPARASESEPGGGRGGGADAPRQRRAHAACLGATTPLAPAGWRGPLRLRGRYCGPTSTCIPESVARKLARTAVELHCLRSACCLMGHGQTGQPRLSAFSSATDMRCGIAPAPFGGTWSSRSF